MRPIHQKKKTFQSALYIILLIMALGMMFALKNCTKQSDSQERVLSDTIVVAIEYSPNICYTYSDTLGGFHYDLWRMISAKQNRPVKFIPVVSLQSALAALDKGTVDVVVAQYPVTKENRGKYLFTDKVCVDKQVLVQRRGEDGVKIKNQIDLAGDTVHVVGGSPMCERISNLSDEIGGVIHIAEDNMYGPEQLFLQVATGEINYAVINNSVAEHLAKKYENVDVSTSISFSQIQAWVLAKEKVELHGEINSFLKSIQGTEAFTQLSMRYFGK